MTLYIALFLGLLQTAPLTRPRLERTAAFEHPTNITASSWVVLDVETGPKGNIQFNGMVAPGSVIVVASYLRPLIPNDPPVSGVPYPPYPSGGTVDGPAAHQTTFTTNRPAPPRF